MESKYDRGAKLLSSGTRSFPFTKDGYDRKWYGVPEEWRHVVCTCPSSFTKYGGFYDKRYELCGECGKFRRLYTCYCSKCGNFYLHVFKHPNWSPLLNWCWDCLGPDIRSDLPIAYPNDQFREMRPLPDHVKPAHIKTKEELAVELDNFFAMADTDTTNLFD